MFIPANAQRQQATLKTVPALLFAPPKRQRQSVALLYAPLQELTPSTLEKIRARVAATAAGTKSTRRQELIALAFTPGSDRDVIRLDSLASVVRRGVTITAVGEAASNSVEPGSRKWSYKAHNFRQLRGFESILTASTVGILLDYYWVQTAYYRNAYGTNWLESKAPAAFHACPALRFVVLPYDAGSTDVADMVASGAANLQAYGLAVTDMTDEEAKELHPLVVATEAAAKANKSLREADTVQRQRYWRSPAPFVVIHRSGDDWRQAMSSLK